jgi:hypothetical protein
MERHRTFLYRPHKRRSLAMHREDEFRPLANSARKRGYDPTLKAQLEFLAAAYEGTCSHVSF